MNHREYGAWQRAAIPQFCWFTASWALRLAELLRQISLTRKLLPQLAVQSSRDELVSNRSCADLAVSPGIKVIRIPNSGNFGYEEEGDDGQVEGEDDFDPTANELMDVYGPPAG